jgi:hypothetical protein
MRRPDRQLAVAVFVQLFQGGSGAGDLGGVDHAVAVRVKDALERRPRAVALRRGRTAALLRQSR